MELDGKRGIIHPFRLPPALLPCRPRPFGLHPVVVSGQESRAPAHNGGTGRLAPALASKKIDEANA